MAKNLPEFNKKLKEICNNHDVLIKQISVRREYPTAKKFIDYTISGRDDDGSLGDEEPQIIAEIQKFA